MMRITLPKISKAWAGAIVLGCLIAGGMSVVMLMPKAEHPQQTVAISFAEKDTVVTKAPQAETSSHEKEGHEVVIDKSLQETVVAHQEPLELPGHNKTNPDEIGHGENSADTKVINLSAADMTQKEQPVKENIASEKAQQDVEPKEKTVVSNGTVGVVEKETESKIVSTPYYNASCIEARADGKFLPIESPEGLRAFDVYQGDYLPDPTKTYLTLIVSELGSNKALFEQVKNAFPKEVVCAFLASRSLSEELNKEARELGHETILMLPMEPMNYPKSDPGPWALLTNLNPKDNQKRLEQHLSQFTGYIAVTPYMGNRFSRVKKDFQPILTEIKRRGLGYFEPRLVRSKAVQWKPSGLHYAKGNYDIVRGSSVSKVKQVLEHVQKDLSQKHAIILTVQADKVSLQEVQRWLPKVLNETTVLAPLSVMTE